MMFKSLSISLRLLFLVATMTFGSMAFAQVEPDPPVSITNEFGLTGFSYTLKVTEAPEAAGTAGVQDGKMYVLVGKKYTFKLSVTEASNWYIGIKPTNADGITLDDDKKNGSRDGAGPNTTYIYITKTFDTAGTNVIAKARFYKGDDFLYTEMETVDIKVVVIKVDLTAIKFNHKGSVTYTDAGPDYETSDGLIIRNDYSSSLDHKDHTHAGEWAPNFPRNEPFLYVVDNTVTIKARFTIDPAVDVALTIGADAVGCVFPNVTPKEVNFGSGVSVGDANGYVEFNLSGKSHEFDGDAAKNIAKSVDSWQWKITAPFSCDIDVSGPHTCYCVLTVPPAPWYRTKETHPWITALDVAVPWASGQTTGSGAASAITVAFNGSGFGYRIDGNRNFLSIGTSRLMLSQVISELSATPTVVNCDDCGDIVTSFGNLVGCNLASTELGTSFRHNPVVLIGTSGWYPCPADLQLNHHTVAADGTGLYDACYRFDDAPTDGYFPLFPYYATGIDFATYKPWLVEPPDLSSCSIVGSTVRDIK